ALNTLRSPVDQTFMLNGASVRLNVPAGPYVRVSFTNATATFAGLTLGGDFYFDQSTRANGTKVTRLAVQNLTFGAASGDDVPALSNAGAVLIIKPDGIAGTVSGTVSLA